MSGQSRALSLLSDSTLSGLEGVLGECFSLSHLHPWHVRFRRRYAQKSVALPDALKLETVSGRIFKLYMGDAASRFELMARRTSQAAGSGLFPAVLWSNEQALLAEYLPGRQVRFGSRAFSQDLGEALASLHRFRCGSCDSQRVKAGVRRDLALLGKAGLLRSESSGYENALTVIWPADLFCSMDYADIKPGNFIHDEQGRLQLIDIGALRANRPAGQYLCGSFYLRRMDRKAFAEAYMQAGGLPQVVQQAAFLRMLHCIWAAALYVRKMRRVPVWLPFHHFGYRLLALYLLWEFRRLARRGAADLVSL